MPHANPPSLKPRNDNPPDARCSFCGRPRHDTGPMIEGPNNVYICVHCVRAANKIADEMAGKND
jgi:ATP-dependent Clp protease ATP-binding subunit ClpX